MLKEKKQYKQILESLVNQLDITPAQFEKAKNHYESVGNSLQDDKSSIREFDPDIYPQGSFRLGTVIKPLSGKDEFDVDLVCKLDLSKKQITQKELKTMLAKSLMENPIYKNMLSDDEGRRSWRLDYKESPKFHMDILPAIQDDYGWLLEKDISEDYAKHAICITDNESDNYTLITDKWDKSNPIGYAEWFKNQMLTKLNEERRLLANKRNIDIEQIPEYEIKTPLQKAVQLLKRHRDILFGDDKDKPISIIITTLAAKSYNNEDNIYDALKNILYGMQSHIHKNSKGEYEILNPIDPSENFANKWIEYPERERVFFIWLKKAREDIVDLVETKGIENSLETFKEAFGEKIADKALNESGFDHLAKNKKINSLSKDFFDVTYKEKPKWFIAFSHNVSIEAFYKDIDGSWHELTLDKILSEGNEIEFNSITNAEDPFEVFWQVVNTGEEAMKANCLRGNIFPSNNNVSSGKLRHKEFATYRGTHWIQCFIVKNNICIAVSKEFVVKIK